MKNYDLGYQMFLDYCSTYGKDEAVRICNRYLDMQTTFCMSHPEELEFCRGLYAAIQGRIAA